MAANQLADTPENWLKGQAEYTKLTKVNPGLIRMEGIGETRGMPVTDTKTGVTMPMSWNDYNKMSKAEPGRYVSPQYDPTTLGAVGTTKAFTTGKPAEELAAFNTAIQHADLLDEASKALNSKDTKALNSVKNKFKTEFGSSDVTNFDVIANAYAREVNKALTAGHVTDNEIKEAGATIPANASREQIVGAVQSYRNLMKSKVQIRKNQYESGMQGKPAFGQDSPKQDNGGWVMKDGIRVRKN